MFPSLSACGSTSPKPTSGPDYFRFARQALRQFDRNHYKPMSVVSLDNVGVCRFGRSLSATHPGLCAFLSINCKVDYQVEEESDRKTYGIEPKELTTLK
jgi:hypothetical protein